MSDTVKIHTYPDPVLKAHAEEVDNIDEEIQRLADNLIHTMYAAPGIGLAANQVGCLKRVIAFDRFPDKDGQAPCILINPEIILAQGEITRDEACLSVIDYSADVTRSAQVKVRGVDRNGKPLDIEAEGLIAVCLQHEIDHLNGILYIDHISSLKRSLYKKKLKKKLRKK
ncbi:MAG: peptide deformylase [Deltaproteobacteria bacterium]|nr:peptide deformylase [Deltaproteobacteria bacterium]